MFWQSAQLGRNPYLNKGNAFSAAERQRYAMTGGLPPKVLGIDQQTHIFLHTLRQITPVIAKRQALLALYMTNRTLFFHCLAAEPKLVWPLVASWREVIDHNPFNETLQLGRDTVFLPLTLTAKQRETAIQNVASQRKINYIFITDGAALDPAADAGINAELYVLVESIAATAFGGIDPLQILPIVIDAGTSNPALLTSDFYLGVQHNRPNRQDYLAKIDQLGLTLHQLFPQALVYVCNQPGTVLADFYREAGFANQQLSHPTVANIELLGRLLANNDFSSNQRVLLLAKHADTVQLAQLLAMAFQTHDQLLTNVWLADGESRLVQLGTSHAFHSRQPLTLSKLCQSVQPDLVITESPRLLALVEEWLSPKTKVYQWEDGWHDLEGGERSYSGMQAHYLTAALLLGLQQQWQPNVTLSLAVRLGQKMQQLTQATASVGMTDKSQPRSELKALLNLLQGSATSSTATTQLPRWSPTYHDFS